MTLKIPDEIIKQNSTNCPENIIGFCDCCQDGPNYDDICERGRNAYEYYLRYCETHNLEGWEEGNYE